jgi:hypothetical protein
MEQLKHRRNIIVTKHTHSEALVITIKEIGVEVNAEKTMFMVVFETNMQDEVTV